MMSDDRRSIAQSIILTHTTLKDEKSRSIYSYHDIKHGRDHLVSKMRRKMLINSGDHSRTYDKVPQACESL